MFPLLVKIIDLIRSQDCNNNTKKENTQNPDLFKGIALESSRSLIGQLNYLTFVDLNAPIYHMRIKIVPTACGED